MSTQSVVVCLLKVGKGSCAHLIRLRGQAFKFHQQQCYTRRRQFAFTTRAVPFWNKLPAELVSASSVKSFKALMDARWQSLFPKVPI